MNCKCTLNCACKDSNGECDCAMSCRCDNERMNKQVESYCPCAMKTEINEGFSMSSSCGSITLQFLAVIIVVILLLHM